MIALRLTRIIPGVMLLIALPAGTLATQETEQGVRLLHVTPDAPLGRPQAPGAVSHRLQRIVEGLEGPARLALAAGHYYLAPVNYEDPTCGNCEDPSTSVPATRGLLVSGTEIQLTGRSADSVIIHTNAGYGILFVDCVRCLLRDVTVTGGVRDPDGRATDAAVVVRSSSVTLQGCHLRDNIGDSATVASVVVGIAGIIGREDADIQVRGCRIRRNSWDGIALYRGARAEIRESIIDGIDKAAGGTIGGGRGVGIGLTWDSQAIVERNLVRRYWKGIGIFVDARATVRENIVEDLLTWGIAYWAAGSGRPIAFIEDNAVYQTGACGTMIDRREAGDEAPGVFSGNALVRTAQNERYDSGEPYCTQRALAREAIPEGFVIRENLFHNNRQPGAARRVPQLSRSEFLEAAAPLLEALKAHSSLKDSSFLRNFER